MMFIHVMTGARIKGHDHATWDGQLLKIPAVSPTVNNCGVIRVEYFIKVRLVSLVKCS